MRLSTTMMMGVAAALSLALAGCGGGGGGTGDTAAAGGSTTTTTPTPGSGGTSAPATLVGVFIDGPVNGLAYSAQPSGLSGTTSNGGQYNYQPGDTVTFSIPNGGNPIVLATRVHGTGTVATKTFVSSLPNGQQIAELLHALNHGTDSVMDVSGVSFSATVLAEIRAYIASAGATLSGQASDDAFLRHVQDSALPATPFLRKVTGTSNEFLVTVVLPDIQAAITANPGPATIDGKTYKLSGSVVETARVVSPLDASCTPATLTTSANAGAILNVTVSGDIQKAGTYAGQFTSGSFQVVVNENGFTCQVAGAPPFVKAATSQPSTVAPSSGQVTIVSDGTRLTVTGLEQMNVPGCVGGQLTGSVIGLANPMVTLSSTVTCTTGASTLTFTDTIKLVGAI